MRHMRLLLPILLLLAVSPTFAQDISAPKGFHKKVWDATFAMYGHNSQGGGYECTLTSFKKVTGGYLLITAGHCTPANKEVPQDAEFSIADRIDGKLQPIQMIHGVLNVPLDYAVFFWKTGRRVPVISFGDERKERVGNKTVNMNFSLGVTKQMSGGVIQSQMITIDTFQLGPLNSMKVGGLFLDSEFATHGASGSAVVSEKTHKIIGLLVSGMDGMTMPPFIEPITLIETDLAKVKLPE
jgi:Trypsin-like peptidase domain